MRQVLLAGEEAHQRPPLLRGMVANCPAQHRVAALQRIQHRALRHRPLDFSKTSPFTRRQGAQVVGELDPDHGSTWTSTDSTGRQIAHDGLPVVAPVRRDIDLAAGRAEVDAAGVRVSTAMASRSTLT
jgi:hypothetical protein